MILLLLARSLSGTLQRLVSHVSMVGNVRCHMWWITADFAGPNYQTSDLLHVGLHRISHWPLGHKWYVCLQV